MSIILVSLTLRLYLFLSVVAHVNAVVVEVAEAVVNVVVALLLLLFVLLSCVGVVIDAYFNVTPGIFTCLRNDVRSDVIVAMMQLRYGKPLNVHLRHIAFMSHYCHCANYLKQCNQI